MEGFLNIRVRPWLRRLVTRALAIVPAFAVIWLAGSRGTLPLLLLSQVVLSLQLPFAIMPLIHFTNDPPRMGPFASGSKLRIAGWTTALIVIGLNVWMAQQSIADWAHGRGPLCASGLDCQPGCRRRDCCGLLRLDRLPSIPPPRQSHRHAGSRRAARRISSPHPPTAAFWSRSITRRSTASR